MVVRDYTRLVATVLIAVVYTCWRAGVVLAQSGVNKNNIITIMEAVTNLERSTDPALDVKSNITELTKRETLAVQQTWEEVLKLGTPTVGVALFDLFFSRNPNYVQFFKALRDVPAGQLKTHPRLKAHGTTVVQTLSGIIQTLDDPETTVLILQKTGRDHVRRKIHAEQFQELHRTVFVLLEQVLGPLWTPLVRESWDKALSVVMKVVLDSLEDEEAKQRNNAV
ncbi:globin-like [Paramacrobiotus metropolitanus]|uniref:globin-like n=1 Tax=Paramacrobiotus metropolitanus TaxID=2943436 RepID=UPI0024458E50|nr:globin-like [Paramacrobiotus metropolitanus]